MLEVLDFAFIREGQGAAGGEGFLRRYRRTVMRGMMALGSRAPRPDLFLPRSSKSSRTRACREIMRRGAGGAGFCAGSRTARHGESDGGWQRPTGSVGHAVSSRGSTDTRASSRRLENRGGACSRWRTAPVPGVRTGVPAPPSAISIVPVAAGAGRGLRSPAKLMAARASKSGRWKRREQCARQRRGDADLKTTGRPVRRSNRSLIDLAADPRRSS